MSHRLSPWRQVMAAASKKPPAVVLFHPNGWADDYDLKPTGPVEIGVRLVSVDVLDTARSVAAKRASKRHQNSTSTDVVWCEAFNEALMQWVVARATCQPDDVTLSYWACPEDVVPVALSSAGLLRLWEEHELLTIGTSVLSPEIEPDGATFLAERLVTGTLYDGLNLSQGRYVRRLLARVLEVAGIEVERPTPTEGVRLG